MQPSNNPANVFVTGNGDFPSLQAAGSYMDAQPAF